MKVDWPRCRSEPTSSRAGGKNRGASAFHKQTLLEINLSTNRNGGRSRSTTHTTHTTHSRSHVRKKKKTQNVQKTLLIT